MTSHRAPATEPTHRARMAYLMVGAVGVVVILMAAIITTTAAMASPQRAAAQAAQARGLVCTQTDKPNGGFTLDCDPQGGTPSPSSTATSSPTPTPSPSSGSASPTPSASSSTPSPVPSGASSMNCMPQPSRCGWPDATNTGVPAGTALTVRTGKVTLTAGQQLRNTEVRGCVQIKGPNVLIENVRIVATPGCSYASIDLEDFDTTNARILHVEIDMSQLANTSAFTGRLNQRAITGDNFLARWVWWHGGSDCVHYGSNVTIQDSFCDVAKIPSGYPGDPHIDGFQSAGGSNVMITHNTIRNPNDQTSAIINGTTPGVSAPQFNVHIVDNLMAGGGWTVYCNAHEASTSPTVEFRGNRIARAFYTWPIGPSHPADRGGYWGPTTDCAGVPGANTTVWDEDNTPIKVG